MLVLTPETPTEPPSPCPCAWPCPCPPEPPPPEPPPPEPPPPEPPPAEPEPPPPEPEPPLEPELGPLGPEPAAEAEPGAEPEPLELEPPPLAAPPPPPPTPLEPPWPPRALPGVAAVDAVTRQVSPASGYSRRNWAIAAGDPLVNAAEQASSNDRAARAGSEKRTRQRPVNAVPASKGIFEKGFFPECLPVSRSDAFNRSNMSLPPPQRVLFLLATSTSVKPRMRCRRRGLLRLNEEYWPRRPVEPR